MTHGEARRVVALVAAFFPGLALEEPTYRVWASELERFDAGQATAGVRKMGRELGHEPRLTDVMEACREQEKRAAARVPAVEEEHGEWMEPDDMKAAIDDTLRRLAGRAQP